MYRHTRPGPARPRPRPPLSVRYAYTVRGRIRVRVRVRCTYAYCAHDRSHTYVRTRTRTRRSTGRRTRRHTHAVSTKHVLIKAYGNPIPEHYVNTKVGSQAHASRRFRRQTESVVPLIVAILSPHTVAAGMERRKAFGKPSVSTHLGNLQVPSFHFSDVQGRNAPPHPALKRAARSSELTHLAASMERSSSFWEG